MYLLYTLNHLPPDRKFFCRILSYGRKTTECSEQEPDIDMTSKSYFWISIVIQEISGW